MWKHNQNRSNMFRKSVFKLLDYMNCLSIKMSKTSDKVWHYYVSVVVVSFEEANVSEHPSVVKLQYLVIH